MFHDNELSLQTDLPHMLCTFAYSCFVLCFALRCHLLLLQHPMRQLMRCPRDRTKCQPMRQPMPQPMKQP